MGQAGALPVPLGVGIGPMEFGGPAATPQTPFPPGIHFSTEARSVSSRSTFLTYALAGGKYATEHSLTGMPHGDNANGSLQNRIRGAIVSGNTEGNTSPSDYSRLSEIIENTERTSKNAELLSNHWQALEESVLAATISASLDGIDSAKRAAELFRKGALMAYRIEDAPDRHLAAIESAELAANVLHNFLRFLPPSREARELQAELVEHHALAASISLEFLQNTPKENSSFETSINHGLFNAAFNPDTAHMVDILELSAGFYESRKEPLRAARDWLRSAYYVLNNGGFKNDHLVDVCAGLSGAVGIWTRMDETPQDNIERAQAVVGETVKFIKEHGVVIEPPGY